MNPPDNDAAGAAPTRFGQRPDLDVPAALLFSSAPSIEAAGDYWRAVRLGVLGVDRELLPLLLSLVPESRGGRLRHPDADADWQRVVAEAVDRRDLDLDAMREMYDCMEADQAKRPRRPDGPARSRRRRRR